ncbi:tRNA (adenosine(37)-N6)-threonylcarbamoyltransferase complex transferase subunit TsaD [Entomobacter blattae]|nr:tRNA (adenosine(37)-N6)-threonylcarbamoyltransferase complex transferase subunit TsaD [Entomobacter blattae]
MAVAPIILAIETSCDETACAIVDSAGSILAEQVFSQMEHAPFGGVIPEIAARNHLSLLPSMLEQTLAASALKVESLTAIAASTGPGLIGGLIVGSTLGKGLAMAWQKPFIAINHIEAHALTPRLPLPHTLRHTPRVDFPYLLFLASGGHCQCIAVKGIGDYRKLGGTVDDAAGEAFDKVAKMLGLGWPGGAALEALAKEGNPKAYPLPHPMVGRAGCDFSFSGLKTSVSHLLMPYGHDPLPRQMAADIAASFQYAVTHTIEDRLTHALALFPQATALVTAGGVAANMAIRATLADLAARHNKAFMAPPLRLCTDNAVMVAWCAQEIWQAAQKKGIKLADRDGMAARPRPRWPLEELRQRFSA